VTQRNADNFCSLPHGISTNNAFTLQQLSFD